MALHASSSIEAKTKSMNSLWRRTSVLGLSTYATISADSLFEHYQRDNEQAAAANVEIPRRPAAGTDSRGWRVCQWNVHYFHTMDSSGNFRTTYDEIYQELMKHDPDIIVLNEAAADDPAECLHFMRRLVNAGYQHWRVANIHFPTAMLVRHSGEIWINEIALDAKRTAVVMGVQLPQETDITARDSSGTTKPRTLWIYGTHLHHLEDCPGRRSLEMQTLLNHAKDRPPTDALLIVGDFNQQRPQDYASEEWERILANKAHRGESTASDGVAELLEAQGLACVWDNDDSNNTGASHGRNWSATDPPPATHWSGTVIDYAYSRHVRNVGVYVSPAGWSDHRLVITDWII